jgi:hypothetical protein
MPIDAEGMAPPALVIMPPELVIMLDIPDIMTPGMFRVTLVESPLTHFATSTRVPETVVSAPFAALATASAIALAPSNAVRRARSLYMISSLEEISRRGEAAGKD